MTAACCQPAEFLWIREVGDVDTVLLGTVCLRMSATHTQARNNGRTQCLTYVAASVYIRTLLEGKPTMERRVCHHGDGQILHCAESATDKNFW